MPKQEAYVPTEDDKIVTEEYHRIKAALLEELDAELVANTTDGEIDFPFVATVEISKALTAHPFYVKNLRGAELKWLTSKTLQGSADVIEGDKGDLFQVTVEKRYVKKS